jgi:hypothetical protein
MENSWWGNAAATVAVDSAEGATVGVMEAVTAVLLPIIGPFLDGLAGEGAMLEGMGWAAMGRYLDEKSKDLISWCKTYGGGCGGQTPWQYVAVSY